MSTRTRTTRNVTPATVTYASKSDHARALLRSGRTISQVAHDLNIGYAFAYGIAKRAGLAETAANRRPTKSVITDPTTKSVTVQTAIGPVIVHPDGRVIMPKIARVRKPKESATE